MVLYYIMQHLMHAIILIHVHVHTHEHVHVHVRTYAHEHVHVHIFKPHQVLITRHSLWYHPISNDIVFRNRRYPTPPPFYCLC